MKTDGQYVRNGYQRRPVLPKNYGFFGDKIWFHDEEIKNMCQES